MPAPTLPPDLPDSPHPAWPCRAAPPCSCCPAGWLWCRGEPYFKRSDLQELHTVTQWRTEGWEVRPEELASPYKRVKRRGSSARSKTAAAAAAAAVAEVDGWARDGGEEEDGEEVCAAAAWRRHLLRHSKAAYMFYAVRHWHLVRPLLTLICLSQHAS